MKRRNLFWLLLIVSMLVFVGGDCDDNTPETINRVTKTVEKTETNGAGQIIESVYYNDIGQWFNDHNVDREIVCITHASRSGQDNGWFLIISKPIEVQPERNTYKMKE